MLEDWRSPLLNDGCRSTGAVAVIPAEMEDALTQFPAECRDSRKVDVPAVPDLGTARMSVVLTYIPASGTGDCNSR